MANPAKTLPVGTVLNSGYNTYTIVKVLGQGGFGITYQATKIIKDGNIKVKINVAIKEHFVDRYCGRDSVTRSVVYSQPVADEVESSRRDFLAEARRLRELSDCHNNIVCVNEAFEANNTAYFVMEYLEGESLADCVKRRGPLSEAEVRSVMLPIINAVAFLHDRRITHLDIKPANIMLTHDEDGNFRSVLIDFGLSRHFDPVTDTPSTTIRPSGFTPGYAPVEQQLAFTKFLPAADVYSLGATMLFALTGRTPMAAEELDEEMLRAYIPDGLSAAMETSITAAMQHFSKHRPANAVLLLSLLKADSDTATYGIPLVTPVRVPQSEPIPLVTPVVVPEKGTKAVKESAPVKPKSNRMMYAVIFALFLMIGGAVLFFSKCSGYGEKGGVGDSESVMHYVSPNEAVADTPAVALETTPMEVSVVKEETPEETPVPEAKHETQAEKPKPEAKPEVDKYPQPHARPHHLDLAVGYNGTTGYFSSDEWTKLPASEKSKYRRKGMVVATKGQRFIVELNDKEGGREMTWGDAMDKYKSVMPTKEQGKALVSIDLGTWETKMNAYGGDATYWFWTRDEADSSNAWHVSMNYGLITNYTKIGSLRVRAVAPVLSSSAR